MYEERIKEGKKQLLERLSAWTKKRAIKQNAELIAAPALWGAMGLLLSGSELMLGISPFGVSIICSAEGFMNSSAALCGAVLGAAGKGVYGLWQIGICLCAYLLRIVFSGILMGGGKSFAAYGMRERISFRLMASLAAAVGAGAVGVVLGESLYKDIYAALGALVLYPGFTYAFILALSRSRPQSSRMAGLCAAMYAITLSVSRLGLPFNAGVVVAFVATAAVSFRNGAVQGAAVGAFSAMALETVYVPVYPLMAFAMGLLRKYSRSGAIGAGAAVGISHAISLGGFYAMGELLPEFIFTAALLAPAVNMGLFEGGEIFEAPKENVDLQDIKGEELERRLGKLSMSFADLSKLLVSVTERVQRPTAEEAESICGAAGEKYCRGCVHKDLCFSEKAGERREFFRQLKERLCGFGNAGANIIPARLALRCHNADGILEFANTAAKIKGKLAAESCKTRLFASDYKAMAALIREAVSPESRRWARDEGAEKALKEKLSERGSEFAGISVYGSRMRKLYFRGMAMPNPAGEDDLRRLGEEIAGTRLSSPVFTINGRDISAYMHSVPAFSISCGRYSASGKGDKESGDTAVSFENEEGYYYALISDGMGSGREAALTSGISALFLEKLLMAGAPMKSSLEMLNSFVCGGEGECFTTVDLMEADLYTGRVSFIKSGAAPSFVIRNGKVFRLHSKTVPVGIIRALDAETISFEMKEGDRIVMVSDGVTGSYEACPWLYEVLESCEITDLPPAKAARRLGELAAKKTGKGDDITVAVISVKGA